MNNYPDHMTESDWKHVGELSDNWEEEYEKFLEDSEDDFYDDEED